MSLATIRQNATDFLMSLPMVQQHLAAAEAKHQSSLVDHAAAFVEIGKQEAVDSAQVKKLLDAKTAEVKAADAVLKKLVDERSRLIARLYGVGASADIARREHQAPLFEANADDVQTWLDDKFLPELTRLRNTDLVQNEIEERNTVRGATFRVCTHSNSDSIADRIRAVVSACVQADGLRSSVADAGAELQKLWDALPEIELRKTGR